MPFFEAFGQRPFELRRVDILFEPEVYDRPGCRVEDIVSLLLSQYLAEILADIFPLRVALDRKVAAVEVVEVVHADREFVAVCVVARAADDLLAALEHHHVERHFEHLAAAAEDQPVFRYDQLERPCVIGHVVGQCADVFADPLASPRPGFEPRPDAESVCGEVLQAAAQVGALGPGDLPFALPVDDYADAGQQLLLVAVQYDPVDEIESLVHLFSGARAAWPPGWRCCPHASGTGSRSSGCRYRPTRPASRPARRRCRRVCSSPPRGRVRSPAVFPRRRTPPAAAGCGSRRSGRRRPDRGRPGVRSPPAAAGPRRRSTTRGGCPAA